MVYKRELPRFVAKASLFRRIRECRARVTSSGRFQRAAGKSRLRAPSLWILLSKWIFKANLRKRGSRLGQRYELRRASWPADSATASSGAFSCEIRLCANLSDAASDRRINGRQHVFAFTTAHSCQWAGHFRQPHHTFQVELSIHSRIFASFHRPVHFDARQSESYFAANNEELQCRRSLHVFVASGHCDLFRL